MFPDRKTRSDHRYQLSRRYPSVIRTLSGMLSTSAHPRTRRKNPLAIIRITTEPLNPTRQKEKAREREGDNGRGGKGKWFHPKHEGPFVVAFYCKRSDSLLVNGVVFTDYSAKEYLSLISNSQSCRIDLSVAEMKTLFWDVDTWEAHFYFRNVFRIN